MIPNSCRCSRPTTLITAFCSTALLLAGCTAGARSDRSLPEQGTPAGLAYVATSRPLAPEKAEQLLDVVGENWLYGNGIGSTALNLGAAVAFPPYALVLLGNAALTIAGYEPIEVSKVLPEEIGNVWSDAYDGVTSGPGRVAAFVADREFITPEHSAQRVRQVLESDPGRAADRSIVMNEQMKAVK